MDYRRYIDENVLDAKGNPKPSALAKGVADPIVQAFPAPTVMTSLWLAYNGEAMRHCQHCNKPLEVLSFRKGVVKKYCSEECKKADPAYHQARNEGIRKIDWEARNEKSRQTCLERYGTTHYLKNEDRKEAAKKTLLDRYGVENPSCNPDIRIRKSETVRRMIDEGSSIFARRQDSTPEKMINDLLDSIGVSYVMTRSIIWPLELDVYIPEHKVAFEVNGAYWHSSTDAESDRIIRNRHLDKSLKCREAGIRLVHLTDHEIINRWDVVKSMILSILGKTDRMTARKTVVGLVDSAAAKTFLDASHIQGAAPCGLFYGLYHNQVLVSVMGFNKARFDKRYDWELVRFATKEGMTVVGGFSKLLKHFRKLHSGSIVSYADFSRSNGDVYRKNGFVEVGLSKPSYRWYSNNRKKLYNRHTMMRRNLPKILDHFDPTLTEAENCWREGYRKLWDCGQIKFVLE